MKLGNQIYLFLISFILFNSFSFAQDKITTSPLINLEKIKPSFETPNEKNEEENIEQGIKVKKKINKSPKSSHAVLIGLDKITAKSRKIIVKLDEATKFGPLEIKILKCGKVRNNNKINDVAYMQVKDLSKNENEKVFIFNGWTFSSDPNLTPFDHAIYDLQLINCDKV